MKKLILCLISLFVSISCYADFSGAYQAGKEKVVNFVSNDNRCPIHSETPLSKIKRPPWEVEVGFNLMYSPSNGGYQFRTDSLTLEVVHNLSTVFGVFVKYDNINYDKDKYDNTKYDNEWTGYNAVAGVHIYITPIIRIYGGFGYFALKDNDGNQPDYETANELGIKFDIPMDKWGYKLVLGYKMVEAHIADDNLDASEAIADGSYNAISFTISLPFGYE